MIKQNDAVPSRANNDEKPARYSTEILDDDVINGFVYRAKLFEQMESTGHCHKIIEAGIDD